MEQLVSTYSKHLSLLNEHMACLFSELAIDCLVIASGEQKHYFRDDQGRPFKPSAYFSWFLPLNMPACFVVLDAVNQPKLLVCQPRDFWHQPVDLSQYAYLSCWDVIEVANHSELNALLPQPTAHSHFVGEDLDFAQALGFSKVNAADVLHFLDYQRGFKTDYEIDCLRQATHIALRGHEAIAQSVLTSPELSERALNQIYLNAVGEEESEQPYRAIIAHNEHAAILHYQNRSRVTATPLSLLVDAGATLNHYAADITRTYAYRSGLYADLLQAFEKLHLNIVEQMPKTACYSQLHDKAVDAIAQFLLDHQLAYGSVESLKEQGVVRAFFPHGLGHLLGLQVHDVGGNLITPWATALAKSQKTVLRNQRPLTPGIVMTVEPGLYFIEQLLSPLKASSYASMINWNLVDTLMPYGGIRIEDNLVIHDGYVENLTRDVCYRL
jgi:Xaa-Pro dipeptidase